MSGPLAVAVTVYVSVALVPWPMVWFAGEVMATAEGTSVTVTLALAVTGVWAVPPASL